MSGPDHDQGDPVDQPKGPETILDQEIESGLAELERPTRGLLLSGLSAGLDIGFSVLVIGAILTITQGSVTLPVRLLLAAAYSVGFLFVIFGRSELYTEHTTMAVLPVLARRANLRQLGRLWGLIYAANLAGTAVFAALLAAVGPALGILDEGALVAHAGKQVAHPWWVMALSAVLAGWMMGLVTWLITAARNTTSEIILATLVTATIGFAHLHHCILGSVELLTSMLLAQSPSIGGYLRYMVLVTAGNTVGGVVFVAIVKFGHASSTRRLRPRALD